MRHSFFFLGSWDNCARVNKHLRDSLLFTSEKTNMLTKGSALNVGKGWAVASLFRKARENRRAKFLLKVSRRFFNCTYGHSPGIRIWYRPSFLAERHG